MGVHLAEAAHSTVRSDSGEPPLEQLGRYRILQKLGEGGCGVVYMAEQQEPVRRRVALKVIKLGMDTRQVIARFEAERQALALMDHPNIAKVLDAGATANGRPYFVMELVRGLRITDYCDEHNVPTSERLRLFVEVCRAVQHAHQKGIIHRDLKPSNILVALNDGVAMPKVIDFGIAKVTTGQPLTDKTLFTAIEQFMGTPAYMSPEQAGTSGLDIDTRSDIYSLGVLLYELLAGKTPFDASELLAAGLEAMRRTIREQDPLRPSTRLSEMAPAEQETIAKRRQAEPLKLIRLLSGELDWVVMKCLEKDRSRRYATVNGLAVDVLRLLANEPVTARPPSAVYRCEKFVRRHKLPVAAMAGFVAALLAGLSMSVWLYYREVDARKRADIARANETRSRVQAQEAEQSARAVSEVRRLNSLALLQLQVNEPELARKTAQEALSAAKKAGLGLRESAAPLVSLASIEIHQDNFQRGEQFAREALSALGKVELKDDPDAAFASLLLVDALTLQQKEGEAGRLADGAPELTKRILQERKAILQQQLSVIEASKSRARAIACANNLKQLGLAFIVWAYDHNEQFPFNVGTNAGGSAQFCKRDPEGFEVDPVAHLRLLSTELPTPKVLVCPNDSKTAAADWSKLQSSNVSYRIRSGPTLNLITRLPGDGKRPYTSTNTHDVLAVCPLHGHVLLCDGKVEEDAQP
jgi:hypothetical protein